MTTATIPSTRRGQESRGRGRIQLLVARAVLDGRPEFRAAAIGLSRTSLAQVARQAGMRRVNPFARDSYFVPSEETHAWAQTVIQNERERMQSMINAQLPRSMARRAYRDRRRISQIMRSTEVAKPDEIAMRTARAWVSFVLEKQIDTITPADADVDAISLARAAAEGGLILTDARICAWSRPDHR